MFAFNMNFLKIYQKHARQHLTLTQNPVHVTFYELCLTTKIFKPVHAMGTSDISFESIQLKSFIGQHLKA